MNANHDGSKHGIFTNRPRVLTNDFFTVLTSIDYQWKKADQMEMTFRLENRATGENLFIVTRSDLVFGSNSQLRAVAEVFAGSDGHRRFVKVFVKAKNKVMMLDRFEIKVCGQ